MERSCYASFGIAMKGRQEVNFYVKVNKKYGGKVFCQICKKEITVTLKRSSSWDRRGIRQHLEKKHNLVMDKLKKIVDDSGTSQEESGSETIADSNIEIVQAISENVDTVNFCVVNSDTVNAVTVNADTFNADTVHKFTRNLPVALPKKLIFCQSSLETQCLIIEL